ncbi:hypothetical protein TSAR_013766 [Trichomalopsis sarcophagae]|uniref:Uncharacterized protein n=1 Tax=Trichomalopsis sarcophagae TaxID=543379 RepID=A0A232FNG1_9HYME|nr:hypothetical protein TSAR_013766 [Trichomalopsis sarcophagae]
MFALSFSEVEKTPRIGPQGRSPGALD